MVAAMLLCCLAPQAFSPGTLQSQHISHARTNTRVTPLLASESLAVTTSKAVIGIASAPITLASLFSLITTGCGLPGELLGTLEGLAYLVVAGFALSSLFTRATTGNGLREAELLTAAAEAESLEAAGASEIQKKFSAQKVEDLAKKNGPADLLAIAEACSVVTAAVAILVLGGQLVATGSLPSAVPNGGACWE